MLKILKLKYKEVSKQKFSYFTVLKYILIVRCKYNYTIQKHELRNLYFKI